MKMQMAVVVAALLAAETATAKRDFFVQNEVRCENIGETCFEAATDRPLTGELRFYYPEGATKIKATYANGHCVMRQSIVMAKLRAWRRVIMITAKSARKLLMTAVCATGCGGFIIATGYSGRKKNTRPASDRAF